MMMCHYNSKDISIFTTVFSVWMFQNLFTKKYGFLKVHMCLKKSKRKNYENESLKNLQEDTMRKILMPVLWLTAAVTEGSCFLMGFSPSVYQHTTVCI